MVRICERPEGIRPRPTAYPLPRTPGSHTEDVKSFKITNQVVGIVWESRRNTSHYPYWVNH